MLAGWQSRTTAKLGSAERDGLGSHSGDCGVGFEQICTRMQAHNELPNAGCSVRSLPFHADPLSLSNVWYAGIQTLLNDLISMGLLRHRPQCVCLCVFIYLQALPLDKAQYLAGQTDND